MNQHRGTFFDKTGLSQNFERIESLTGTAKYRMPDALDKINKTLTEVKGVQYQGLTNQIKDFLAYSLQKGYRFELITKSDTVISKPLQNIIDAGNIIHKTIK